MRLSWIPGLLLLGACTAELTATVEAEDEAAAAAEGTAAPSALDVLRTSGHGHGGGHGGDAALRRALRSGAARLSDLAADAIGDAAGNGLVDDDPDDGGWDFALSATATEHTASASPRNLYGATALGPWAALQAGAAGNRALTTLLDAGRGMQADPDVDSAPDFVFGVLLAELAENDGFAQLARERYDAKRAAAGGAAALGAQVRDGRHAGGADGLIAYDLGWLSLAAAALDDAFPGAGYGADAATYAQLVVDDLTGAAPRFDLDDPHERFYVTGLAWSQLAAARVGDRDTQRAARERLLAQQDADGAWPANADSPVPDLQSTAHALQTLALTARLRGAAGVATARGARWLLGQQTPAGGWPIGGSLELPLVDSDVLLALVLARTDAIDAEDLGARRRAMLAPAPGASATPAAPAAPVH